MRLSCGYYAADRQVAVGLLGPTRTYPYPLVPAGPGISPGLRGRLISLNGSGGRSSTGRGPWGRSRAMRGWPCRRGPQGRPGELGAPPEALGRLLDGDLASRVYDLDRRQLGLDEDPVSVLADDAGDGVTLHEDARWVRRSTGILDTILDIIWTILIICPE